MKYDSKEVGCWIDGSASRSVEELNDAIIEMASLEGWEPDEETRNLLENREQEADFLTVQCEIAEDALSWLNDSCTEEGVVFIQDDGLYLVDEEEDLA